MKHISNIRAIQFLWSYMRPYLPSIISGILLLMAVDMVQLIIPRIVKATLDTLGESHFSSTLILKNALSIAGLAAAMTLLRFLFRILLFLPSRKIERRMRDDLFTHLTRLPASFFTATKTGDLMALFTNDLNAVRMATGVALIAITDALFMGGMSLVFMAIIDVKLTFVSIAPLPVIALGMIGFGSRIQSRFSNVQESFGTVSSQAQETLSGIRAVKGFVQERAELTAFSVRCDEYADTNIRLVKVWGLLFPLISLIGSLSLGMLFFFGGRQVIGGTLSFGSFVSFTFYIQLLLWPIMAIGWAYNIGQRGLASAKRLIELRETTPEIAFPQQSPTSTSQIKGHIALRNCTFRYAPGDRAVLHDITLEVPTGSSLGIIGKPGAGKTSLVNLLFHLHPVDRGCLFIDNIDINDWPLPVLRKSIGYVPQDSFLFSDTIGNNITFGLDDHTIEEPSLQRIGQMAAIDKDISRFPQGYATIIGERGITLSGGQKQRLSIARALILRPSILILDDALSSVDTGTEQEILTSMKGELRGRTSLVIAHRISTVRNCDSIIVLDQGIISEQGTHDELVAAGGFYARLYALQALKTEQGYS